MRAVLIGEMRNSFMHARNYTLLQRLREEDVPPDVEVVPNAVRLQQRRAQRPPRGVGDACAREEELTTLSVGGQLNTYVTDGITQVLRDEFSSRRFQNRTRQNSEQAPVPWKYGP